MKISTRHRLAVAAAALSLAVGATVSVATAAASSASTPGGACVFNAPYVVDGLGHVGWGFELPGGNWEYGANNGSKNGKEGGPSNTWHLTGSKAAVIASFAHGGYGQDNHNYTRYQVRTVAAPDASAAQQQVSNEQGEPYYLATEDCETDAYQVLSGYGVKGLPSLVLAIPDVWFTYLNWAGFGNIVSL